MSFFLLDEEKWSNIMKFKKDMHERTHNFDIHNQVYNKFDQYMQKHFKDQNPSRGFTNTFKVHDINSKNYGALISDLPTPFKGLQIFKYRYCDQRTSVLFSILDRFQHPFKFESKQHLMQFYRKFLQSKETNYLHLKIILNTNNQRIQVQIPYFANSKFNSLQQIDKIMSRNNKNLVKQIYRTFFHPLIPHFLKALNYITPIQNQIEQIKNDLSSSVHRYCKMMTLKAYLSSDKMIRQETRNMQLKMRGQNIQNIHNSSFLLSAGLTCSISLFMINSFKANEETLFTIKDPEQRWLVSCLIDPHSTNQDQHESHSNILNFVKLHQPDEIRTYPLGFGGFSTIQSAEISFWFVDSFATGKSQSEINCRQMMTRYVAIKKQNRSRGKNLHELKILQQIRNGLSCFLPRYYIPVNIPNNNYNQKPILMMDLIPQGNLAEYLRDRFKFMTLHTKIYILYSITMSLRFLQAYEIVHLDLKPSNIMLESGLFVKLIDFGEAYHPQVCKIQAENYRPGFTIPYSPPQVTKSNLKQGFTSKTDVYSLGILMFEVLYGRLPSEKIEVFFTSSQFLEDFGNPLIMRIINWIISRCFDKDCQFRPQLDWIAVILRLCLEMSF